MRLWHIDLLKYLPRQQLLGQHRECAALRGNGWGRSQSTVNYVFRYPYEMLYEYHLAVMIEMRSRNYTPNANWDVYEYRGKHAAKLNTIYNPHTNHHPQYPEHNSTYLLQCIRNLKRKFDAAPLGKYDVAELSRFYEFIQTVEGTECI
jgi:uncharacterized protein (TIGR02328 family)